MIPMLGKVNPGLPLVKDFATILFDLFFRLLGKLHTRTLGHSSQIEQGAGEDIRDAKHDKMVGSSDEILAFLECTGLSKELKFVVGTMGILIITLQFARLLGFQCKC